MLEFKRVVFRTPVVRTPGEGRSCVDSQWCKPGVNVGIFLGNFTKINNEESLLETPRTASRKTYRHKFHKRDPKYPKTFPCGGSHYSFYWTVEEVSRDNWADVTCRRCLALRAMPYSTMPDFRVTAKSQPPLMAGKACPSGPSKGKSLQRLNPRFLYPDK